LTRTGSWPCELALLVICRGDRASSSGKVRFARTFFSPVNILAKCPT